jgi:N-acetylmuramoyl-L-alanine amidase
MIGERTCWLAAFGALIIAATVAASAKERRPLIPGAENLAIATDARLAGDENRTRFVIDLSKGVSLTAFTLADPYRVVIDLSQVIFQLPSKAGEEGRGLIKAYRFGLVMPGGSRIVIDVTRPVRIEKAFVLEPVDGQPARLVVDLTAVDRAAFLQTLAVETKLRRSAEPGKKLEQDQTENADPRPLIMIDPGHGGLDNGTTALSGEMEKNIVLDFALQLRDKLQRNGKYRVEMTRTDDRFITLAERVRLARQHQASLFVSIHADALPRREGEARGATVYTLSETATDAEAARLAEAENKADLLGGVDLRAEPDDVADILIDLAQRETKSFSVQFAKGLVGELKTSAKLHKHPLKSAGFRVLKAPDVPSVLVELGFVTSSQDLKLLTSETWRARAADSIVQAIHTFFKTRMAGENRSSRAN